MNTYSVKCSYEDRSNGKEGRTIRVEATTIAGALGKAARDFFKSLDRKQRFDANKGLTLEASRAEGEAETKSEDAADKKSSTTAA